MNKLLLSFLLAALATSPALAIHPLVSDDAGTLGRGGFQVEVSAHLERDSSGGDTLDRVETAPTFLFGLSDRLDVVASVPFASLRAHGDSGDSRASGISDASFEAKWRFFESKRVSFALKPGLSVPTGNRGAGLSSERFGQSIALLASVPTRFAAFHANAGYAHSDNVAGERKDVWSASLGSEIPVSGRMRLALDVGAERNAEIRSSHHPAFVLGGLIFKAFEGVELDVGYKRQLTETETDHAFMAGAAFGF
jgi:hypothetical protein